MAEMGETSAGNQDGKPKDLDKISLKFVNQKGEETYFLVRRKLKMSKVFGMYNQRNNLQDGTARFFYRGGCRVHATLTPHQLGMEEGEEIEVLVQQGGGGYHI